MPILNARFLALPLIALAVIAALGIQGPRAALEKGEIVRAPMHQQWADIAKAVLVR
jgi:hypothetical protein